MQTTHYCRGMAIGTKDIEHLHRLTKTSFHLMIIFRLGLMGLPFNQSWKKKFGSEMYLETLALRLLTDSNRFYRSMLVRSGDDFFIAHAQTSPHRGSTAHAQTIFVNSQPTSGRGGGICINQKSSLCTLYHQLFPIFRCWFSCRKCPVQCCSCCSPADCCLLQ